MGCEWTGSAWCVRGFGLPLLSVVAIEDVRRAIGTLLVCCCGGKLEISLTVEIVLAVSAVLLGLLMLAVEMEGCLNGRIGTDAWNCCCGCCWSCA